MFGMQGKPTWGMGGGFGSMPTATTSSVPGNAFGMMSTAAPSATGTAVAGQSATLGAPQQGFNAFGSAQAQLQPSGQAAAGPTATQVAVTPTWQDFTRQSALASYLHEFDKAYNALHPQCRFRAFMYNACGTGQAVDAIQRERYIAFLHGGGCAVEDYVQAQQANPDPVHLYPSPLHFAQELQQRVAKQHEALGLCVRRAEELLQDVAALVTLQEEHQRTMRTVREQEAMLRGRWLAVLHHCETLRRVGCTSAEESLLLQRVQALRDMLAMPGRYRDALAELQPYIDTELTSRSGNVGGLDAMSDGGIGLDRHAKLGGPAARGVSGDVVPPLRPEVDAMVMWDWLSLARKMQSGIEALHALIEQDLSEMRAARLRCSG